MNTYQIKKKIAGRLKELMEIQRISKEELAQKSGVDDCELNSLLEAKDFISPQKLALILSVFKVGLCRFLSIEYQASTLFFRNVSGNNKKNFDLIRELIPLFVTYFEKPVRKNFCEYPQEKETTFKLIEVIEESLFYAEKIKEEVGANVSEVLKELKIPLLPVYLEEDFEGFLYKYGNDYSVIGYNPIKPLHRIVFTLCHELTHYFLDRKIPTDVDIKINLFLSQFNDQERIELRANKVAQFFLCPMKKMERIFKFNSLEEDIRKIPATKNEFNCSSDVIFNCYLDIYHLKKREQVSGPPYKKIKSEFDKIKSDEDQTTKEFLENHYKKNYDIFNESKQSLGEENQELILKYFFKDFNAEFER